MKRTPLQDWLARRLAPDLGGQPLRRENLLAWQMAKFAQALAYVKQNSPFYRERLAGVEPGNIRTPADVAQLPFTCAQDLVQAPLSFLCVSQDEIARVTTMRSSGTTAPPKSLYFTAQDLELTRDFFHHGMSSLIQAGARVAVLLPGEAPGTVGRLLQEALPRLGASALVLGPVMDPQQAWRDILAGQADCLVGLPLQILGLVRRPPPGGLPAGRIKSVLVTADHASPPLKAEIEERLGGQVFDHYGSTEMGLGGGVQCQARQGYHLREADLYFEVVEPRTGALLPPGQPGELVFTTLTRRGMPLIRFRSGDMTAWEHGPCPCGSFLRRLALIQGRLSEGVNLGPGLRVSIIDLDPALLPLPGLWDYSAQLETTPQGQVLTIGVWADASRQDELARTIPAALAQVPVLAYALARGVLSLAPVWTLSQPEISRGGAKRRLLLRGGS